jgi:hypothetical protein
MKFDELDGLCSTHQGMDSEYKTLDSKPQEGETIWRILACGKDLVSKVKSRSVIFINYLNKLKQMKAK